MTPHPDYMYIVETMQMGPKQIQLIQLQIYLFFFSFFFS